jgi:hypothetical protein
MASCDPRHYEPLYTTYTPIIIARESLERSIVFHSPEGIKDPAKIYYKDNFIFISERFKGIHVIDNKDPKNPVNKGYISVLGCLDMAIKNNTLYVDNAVDLVAIDIADISTSKISVKKRIINTFPELRPPDGHSIPSKYYTENRPKNSIIVGWEEKK